MNNMRRSAAVLAAGALALLAWVARGQVQKTSSRLAPSANDQMISNYAQQMLTQGKEIFRYDTFGDEAFWGDALHLHQAIAGEKQGGVGPGVSPKTALAVGLKVDLDALPASLVDQLKAGKVNLDDPATTLALLKLNAVVGVTGPLRQPGETGVNGNSVLLMSFHRRRRAGPRHRSPPGWMGGSRLELGAIVSLSPNLQPFVDYLEWTRPR